MSKVIAVQEEQLNLIKENYFNSVPSVSIPQNNADIISDSLSVEPVLTSTPVASPISKVDMEGQAVNLDFNPTPAGVVSNDVTNQVFGMPTTGESINIFEPLSSVSENVFAVAEEPKQVNSSDNLSGVPYKEPVMNSNTSADDIYITFNALRDKMTEFYNSMNSEIDKIQEQLLQQSGVSLVGSYSNNIDSVTLMEQSMPSVDAVSRNEFSVESNNTNIFDADVTRVVPVSEIATARSLEENSGYPKIA